jgi:hypothetical protein
VTIAMLRKYILVRSFIAEGLALLRMKNFPKLQKPLFHKIIRIDHREELLDRILGARTAYCGSGFTRSGLLQSWVQSCPKD